MNKIQPAVVVVAYNRVAPLQRLLHSLSQARYPESAAIPLVISIDFSGSQDVKQVAEGFEWAHGPKRVVAHEARLGLRAHVLKCGDLSEEYGAIILLEDDLTVSPAYYDFTLQALEAYAQEPGVSGISLYRNGTNPEFKKKKFEMVFSPVHDGFDNYFVQHVATWGQCWTSLQWREFRKWLALRPENAPADNSLLPPSIRSWSDSSSWAKLFQLYMIESGTYFVFPRIALSTNWGEAGTNFRSDTSRYQVPLLMELREWKFSPLNQSLSIYDVQFEILPACLKRANPALAGFDFETDLCAVKEPDRIQKPYVLTSRELEGCNEVALTFCATLFPLEMNVLLPSEGTGIRLVPTSAIAGKIQREEKGAVPIRLQTFQENLAKVLAYEAQKNEIKHLKGELKALRRDLHIAPIRALLWLRKSLKASITFIKGIFSRPGS